MGKRKEIEHGKVKKAKAVKTGQVKKKDTPAVDFDSIPTCTAFIESLYESDVAESERLAVDGRKFDIASEHKRYVILSDNDEIPFASVNPSRLMPGLAAGWLKLFGGMFRDIN